MMQQISTERREYYMRVLMDNFCRTQEENGALYNEIDTLEEEVARLMRENSVLRHNLSAAGLMPADAK